MGTAFGLGGAMYGCGLAKAASSAETTGFETDVEEEEEEEVASERVRFLEDYFFLSDFLDVSVNSPLNKVDDNSLAL